MLKVSAELFNNNRWQLGWGNRECGEQLVGLDFIVRGVLAIFAIFVNTGFMLLYPALHE